MSIFLTARGQTGAKHQPEFPRIRFMKTLKIVAALMLGMLSLVACNGTNLTGGLAITNLRTLENTCSTLTDGKKYLALSFNYVGTLDSLKFSFTPYVNTGTPPLQVVKIDDVTTPPSSFAQIKLNESGVAKVYVSLANATLSSLAVTAPDPKQTRPMGIKLEASNKAKQSSTLELKDVDVSGCY
jgi:hypothetical protein